MEEGLEGGIVFMRWLVLCLLLRLRVSLSWCVGPGLGLLSEMVGFIFVCYCIETCTVQYDLLADTGHSSELAVRSLRLPSGKILRCDGRT